VDDFVEAVGKGVMKRLILDRGFIDGAQMGRCKEQHGVEVLIPLKKNMDVYEDVLGLVRNRKIQFSPYVPPPPKPPVDAKPNHVPRVIRRREEKRQRTLNKKKAALPPLSPDKVVVSDEVGCLSDFRTWSTCPVPLSVAVNRERYADRHEEIWMLADTKNLADGAVSRDDYRLRTGIEERYRQLKCFIDLSNFHSRKFSLVCNQVIFVALAYSLMQLYLLRIKRPELNRRTQPRLRNQLMPTDSVIIIYYNNRFALLSPMQYTELLLTLPGEAGKKILEKVRRLRRELEHELKFVRPP
jgi:hypothetical protein